MALKKFEIVEGATSPLLAGTLVNTAVTVQVSFPGSTTCECVVTRVQKNPATSVTIASTVTDLDARTVTIDAWPAGSTDTPGTYSVEWHVTLGGSGLIEKYPGDNIKILPTLEVV